MSNTFCALKVDRAYAAEVRDLIKKTDNVVYTRMNVIRDKSYKAVHVHGDEEAILNVAESNEHVVDVLYVV